nr:MAG TPA: hypothetical protein [Caudoviricetes sp.]
MIKHFTEVLFICPVRSRTVPSMTKNCLERRFKWNF